MRQYLSWLLQAPCFERAATPELAAGPAASSSMNGVGTRDRLRSLAGDIVCIHGADGRVEDCDVAAAVFSSLPADVLIGDGMLERVHVADRPLFLDALSRAAHQDERVSVEFRLNIAGTAETAPRFSWLEMTASRPVADQARVVTLGRDISRFKAREAELHAARQAAEDANEAKTRFLHTMSHELRTPLNAIIGFSEMMSMPGVVVRNERQMNEYAGIVHNSSKHLLGLIDEVLDMSRLESGHYRLAPETFGVADLVRHAIELVQHEMEAKGVRISVREFDPGLVMTADRRVCRQLLVNLLAALIKSAAPKERLRLKIEAGESAICFRVGGGAEGETEGAGQAAGGLLGALAALLGGEVEAVARSDGRSTLLARLPLLAGCTLPSGSVVRLRGEDGDVERQLSA